MTPQAKYEAWKNLEQDSSQSLEYSMEYLRMCNAEDETLLAMLFKFVDPLCEKLLDIAAMPTLPQIGMTHEVKVLCDMLNPVYCNTINLNCREIIM